MKATAISTTSDCLIDSYGRRITYLRISLTDLCNFRCVYCEPPEGHMATPPSHYLTKEELQRFVRIIGRLGVHQVRLTGGEPLLRRDIVDIVRSLKAVETVQDLSITTNASRLAPLIQPLKEAGLDRVNISLDSLDPKRFKSITLSDAYEDVYKAVFLTLKAGFPVKLNIVILKGLTREEITRFVDLAYQYPLEVRFLEFMPLCGSAWEPDLVLPIRDVRMIVGEHYNLKEIPRGSDVAHSYELVGGQGRVGFIASLTESFCNTCSRFRLSADGNIFPCLFSDVQVSVKQLLRENAPDEEILQAIRLAAQIKPKGNGYQDTPFDEKAPQAAAVNNPLIKTIGG